MHGCHNHHLHTQSLGWPVTNPHQQSERTNIMKNKYLKKSDIVMTTAVQELALTKLANIRELINKQRPRKSALLPGMLMDEEIIQAIREVLG